LLSRFDDAIQKEWIVTNGLGGYASSTVLGINTRKYHGLLVASLHPPRDRRVFLAKLDEEVGLENNVYPLGANEFQNVVFPQGYGFLREFSISPFPKYTYAVQGVEIRKTVFMPYEKNGVIVIYNVANRSRFDVRLQAFPLVSWRHFHSVTDRWKIPVEFSEEHADNGFKMRFKLPQSALLAAVVGGGYFAKGKWVDRVYFREEAHRGESCLDDCYQPGYFEVEVEAGGNGDFAIIAVADENEDVAEKVLASMPATMYDVQALFEKETKRHENFLARFYYLHVGVSASDWSSWLVLATDAFIVRGMGDEQRAVIAGYHWFEPWGRDTFVSLSGLLLVTGRFEDARKLFLTFKKYCSQGLIPNFLPDQAGPPAYNTVDASLWYVNAVLQYLKYTGDFKFVQEQLWDTLKAIVENHIKGTMFEIRLDVDGLLAHDSQLTWMDAAVDGKAVTPRAGKAVEVQALWYNALRTAELLAGRFKESSDAERYGQIAERAQKSFNEKFWDAEKSCLFDVVGEAGVDSSLRPNQVFAVALDFVMLDDVKSEKVVDVVQRELLTPYGLRTLARNDSRYAGFYSGDRGSRDGAYHNGTVWPWLLGPFTTAFLKTKGYSEFRRDYALRVFLAPLFTKQVGQVGLGALNEIFDGEPPHTPRGCITQAWSVAEPLRAYVEDLMRIRPKYEKQVLQF